MIAARSGARTHDGPCKKKLASQAILAYDEYPFPPPNHLYRKEHTMQYPIITVPFSGWLTV